MSSFHRRRFLSKHDGFDDGRGNDYSDDESVGDIYADDNNLPDVPLIRIFKPLMKIFVNFPLYFNGVAKSDVKHMDVTIDHSQRAIGLHMGDIFCVYPYDLSTTVKDLLKHICDLPPFLKENIIKFRLSGANDPEIRSYRKGLLQLTLHDLPIEFLEGSFIRGRCQ